MTSKTFLTVLTAVVIIFLPVHSPWAQTESQDKTETTMSVETPVDPVEDAYIPVTLQSLSKLYWAIGKFDLTNNDAIDNYMLINECELYVQFYHNDIEWKKLHEATRKYLSQNTSKFPTRFELIVPITLDRYDIDTQKFTVSQESQIVNARRLDIRVIDSKQGRTGCRKGTERVKGYNDSMILALSQPFTFVEFEVPPELADMYLAEAKSYYENLPPRLQLSRYERLAYLRLKYRITTYKEDAYEPISHDVKAVVLGRIEGYEVYADPGKYKPLFKKDINNGRRRLRRRKAPIATPVQPAEEVPSGQTKVDFSE